MADAPDSPDSPKTEAIRVVSRALEILRVMNRQSRWTLHELHLQTRLPKSTIYRILYTLKQDGYVSVEGNAGVYRLTERIQEVSGGYTEKSLLVEMGSAAALKLTKSIKWPVQIGVLNDDAIVVRYSGMPYSPVAAHATTLGQRLGLTNTAMGRAYLAFCAPVEREILFDMLRSRPGDELAHEDRLLQELEDIRAQGHSVRQPNETRRTATMAVPILRGEEVAGLMGMTTFGSLMTPATIAQFAPLLKNAAAELARAYEARLLEKS
jgi:IclR family mhp operon transcriptional activator